MYIFIYIYILYILIYMYIYVYICIYIYTYVTYNENIIDYYNATQTFRGALCDSVASDKHPA